MGTDLQESPWSAFQYVHSLGLPGLLANLGCTLLVTTYQAGKPAVFRAKKGKLSLLPRTFEQAMGTGVYLERIAIGSRYEIWMLENDRHIARTMHPAAKQDACLLPRCSHVTGNIYVHDMAWNRPPQSSTGAEGQTLYV